jgi:hypothetical protein
MAITTATLDAVHGAGTLADYQAGYPLFCSHNVLRDAVSIHWIKGEDFPGPPYMDDNNFLPKSILCDGFIHKSSSWDGSFNDGFLVVGFGYPITFDVVAVFFAQGAAAYSSGTLQYISAASQSDYSDETVLYNKSDAPGVSGDRWIYPALNPALDGVPLSITAQYLVIGLTSDVPLSPSEIFIGSRCQMQSFDEMPCVKFSVDRSAYETSISNGATTRIGKYYGRTILNDDYIIVGSQRAKEMRAVIQQDAEPILFCASPSEALASQEANKKTSGYDLFLGNVDMDERSVPEVETADLYKAKIRIMEQGPPFFHGVGRIV